MKRAAERHTALIQLVILQCCTSPTYAQWRFNWSSITPSESLYYHDCYDGLQCARLQAPLDWENPENPRKVAIAIVRLPAKVPIADDRYGGAVLVNPGGPGGSGVTQVVSHGKNMQTIIDSDHGGLHFDMIGFDPRGVGFSTPKLECFPDYLSRQYWVSTAKAEGMLGSSNISFGIRWARRQSLMQSCVNQGASDPNSIGHFMNSVPVVQDMINIIERHGEWRESALETFMEASRRHPALTLQARQTIPLSFLQEKHKWRKGEEKLLYWGVSYGTVIGQLFASMHPHRVSRMLLDAVVDPSGYLNSPWNALIGDSDPIFDRFFYYCSIFEACPFYGQSILELRRQFDELLQSLDQSPIAVPATRENAPDVITRSDLLFELKESVYCPVQKFPYLAHVMAGLWNNNGTLLARRKQAALLSMTPQEYQRYKCTPQDAFSGYCQKPGAWEDETPAAIMCSDNAYLENSTQAQFHELAGVLQSRSYIMGSYWTEQQMVCVSLIFKSKAVILTPWARSAMEAASRFPGSAVLHQNSVGHTFLSSPSLCTAKIVRAYFQDGSLPEPDTMCPPDELPFQMPADDDLSSEVTQLSKALRELAYNCRS
ncbi:spindle pole body-associated protein sad1 [Apiospora arundinis]